MDEIRIGHQSTTPVAAVYLGHLESEIKKRGYRAWRQIPRKGPCSLLVSHPSIKELSETIFAEELEGELWYLWGWGEIIESVSEIRKTADRIIYVLTPQGQSSSPPGQDPEGRP